MPQYVVPENLEIALEVLSGKNFTPLAGGTDFYPKLVGSFVKDNVLDITRIISLRGISDNGEFWRIGATTTWSDIIETRLPSLFNGLKLAARELGGRQIQNVATIGGNICNASPAADGVPALLALDAHVELQTSTEKRIVNLECFLTGNKKTIRKLDELVTGILIPKPKFHSVSNFQKLGSRRYLVISIAMVSTVLEFNETNHISAARIAVGSCSPIATRINKLEWDLKGKKISPLIGCIVQRHHLDVLNPINDIRATSSYRKEVALTLLRRNLAELGKKVCA